MDVDAFVAAHQAEWARLDALVKRRRRLTGAEADELVASYQRTATHLSMLRSAGQDPALTGRLSIVVARARASAVGGAHASGWASVRRFFAVSFPAAAYRNRWWWLGTAAGSVLLALLIGWWMVRTPAVLDTLIGKQQQAQYVNHEFRQYYSQYNGQSFGSEVWTHNSFLAAQMLILGIFLGIPTLFLLLENALDLGSAGALMITHGKGAEFFALITPHGLLELSSVFLAAATGLRLGWTIIDPGPRPRSQALAEEGRAAVTIALGMVLTLLVSGSVESFVTPSPLPTWARITIGACVEVAFLAYVIVLGGRAVRAGVSADIAEAPDVVPVTG